MQKESLLSEQNPNTQVGVHGKYSWLIRILTPLLYVGVVAISQFIGGNSKTGNKQTADQFHLYVVPPGYFFAIWGLIYAGVAIANIYNLVRNVWTLKVHVWFAMVNLFSIAWTLVFDMDTVETVVVSSFLILGLTLSVFATWVALGQVPESKINTWTYVNRNVFALYLGWCIAATNLNFGMDIVYWLGASKKHQMIIFWILTPVCALMAFSFNAVKYGKFGILSCICVWFSVAWAFIGAGMSTYNCLNGLQDLC